MSSLSREFVIVPVPRKKAENIPEPVAQLDVPLWRAEEGYIECSSWITAELMFLANKLGRAGIEVTKVTNALPNDPDTAQVLELYGSRVDDFVTIEVPDEDEEYN